MGYKRIDENLSFADLAISKSLEHNRTLKMLEKISKVVKWENIEALLMEHYDGRALWNSKIILTGTFELFMKFGGVGCLTKCFIPQGRKQRRCRRLSSIAVAEVHAAPEVVPHLLRS